MAAFPQDLWKILLKFVENLLKQNLSIPIRLSIKNKISGNSFFNFLITYNIKN